MHSEEIDFMCLGKVAAGKRTMLTALGIEATERGPDVDVYRNYYLLKDTKKMVSEDTSYWLPATDIPEVNPRRFLYKTNLNRQHDGDLVCFKTFNYAPEYLGEITNIIKNDICTKEIEDTTLRKIIKRIRESEKIVAIIDCERFENDESLAIEDTIEIIKNISNKKIIPVATKTDVFIPKYESEPGYNGDISQNKTAFKKCVHFELKSNPQYNKLIDLTDYVSCFPVHLKTKECEIGEKVPKLPIELHGFQTVLDELAK